jgi:hypothetical protein
MRELVTGAGGGIAPLRFSIEILGWRTEIKALKKS